MSVCCGEALRFSAGASFPDQPPDAEPAILLNLRSPSLLPTLPPFSDRCLLIPINVQILK